MLPFSITSDILDTPCAIVPHVVVPDSAPDVFGELSESGHENDDDAFSCCDDNDFRRNSSDNMKRCIVCLHKMRVDRGRCHNCRRPLHTSPIGLSCYTSVRGLSTDGQFQKWCRECFQSLGSP